MRSHRRRRPFLALALATTALAAAGCASTGGPLERPRGARAVPEVGPGQTAGAEAMPAEGPADGMATGTHAAAAARPAAAADAAPTAAEAQAFVEHAEAELKELAVHAERAAWVQANFITDDTELLAAQASEELLTAAVGYAQEAARFDGLELPFDTRRKIELLKRSLTLPAPADAAKTAELTRITSRLESTYGKGKYCPEGGECEDLQELSRTMAESRDPQELLDAWVGWRTISPPMRDDYARFVELANEGARELGFADVGALWRSKYDMSPEAFAAELERLWGQVQPLYESLHCYVRAKLVEKYGAEVVPPDGPIPAHLLGNMWAQSWANIFDVVAPADAEPGYDLTEILRQRDVSPKEMVRTGEGFFTSLGFAPLPDTFWERSMFTKPADREVVCHASAWDVDEENDLRIKMCIESDGGGLPDHPPRARPQLLPAGLQPAAVPLPRQRQRRLPRGGRRHDRAVGDAAVPGGHRPPRRRAADVEGHRPAAARRARQGGVPALRPADRPVALGGLLRPGGAGGLQPGVVGPAAQGTRASRRRWRAARTTSIPARSTTSRAIRPTPATSSPTSCSSSSTGRCARRPGTRGR